MKNTLKRMVYLLAAAGICLAMLGGCGSEEVNEVTKLSFKSAASYEELKKLDGKTIQINGYLATSSPVDGSFLFLMNLPYQSCPFCVPNTSQLSNTMEVYPRKGETFGYTEQAVKVTGKLVVAPENSPFTDLYGYSFNFKIVDGSYTLISDSELTEEMELWNRFAKADLASEIYRMYEFVNFVCDWSSYKVQSFTDENGNLIPGYYLYASDAMAFMESEERQFGYGRQDGYFEGIIASIKAIDPVKLDTLVKNVEKAKDLSEKAIAKLENGEYISEYKSVPEFGTEDYIFTIVDGDKLILELDALYNEYSEWLSSFEL